MSTGLSLEGYRTFMENLGMGNSDSSCDFTLEDYEGGCFGYAWDLTADRCNGFHTHTPFTGEIVYKQSFRQPIDTGCSLIIYACYDNAIQISKEGGVSLDYIP